MDEDEKKEDIELNEPVEESDDSSDGDIDINRSIDEISEEFKHNLHAEKAAKHSPLNRYWHKIKSWFGVKKNRYIAAGVGLVLVVGIVALPATRFGVLNLFGVRGNVEVVVLDSGSELPLRNVEVTVGDKSALTDRSGQATVSGVRLGSQDFMVEKIAYSTHTDNISIKSGTNTLEPVSLVPVGVQFTFNLSNWLSGTALESVEVSTSENSVLSNADGVAVLTVPPQTTEEIEVQITADGYRTESKTIAYDATVEQDFELVIDSPNFFISKRTGDYDLYKIDLDGTNEELVLEGTGNENDQIQMLTMARSRAVFMVSSREGHRNTDGSILYGLFQVDTVTGEFNRVDESESLRLYGVSGGKLIYIRVASAQSANNAERQKLISYDPISQRSVELAASNHFNSIALTEDSVFYAPSDFYKVEKTPYLFKSNPSNGSKSTIHADEVWTIYRSSFAELTFDAKQDWYSVPIDSSARPTALTGRPSGLEARLYEVSPDDKNALWVDTRDGQGYLIMYNLASAEETILHIQNGLKYPLRWLDENHITFRVNNSGEIADYVVDKRSGEPAKITIVSDVPSYERWYYYY